MRHPEAEARRQAVDGGCLFAARIACGEETRLWQEARLHYARLFQRA
ncbi:MAG TPA: hypothetical protein VGO69_07755 [Pyrinomonadaceae bacterium]|nr:hypothetical protein [Pyrinomonadaceae bacterium]